MKRFVKSFDKLQFKYFILLFILVFVPFMFSFSNVFGLANEMMTKKVMTQDETSLAFAVERFDNEIRMMQNITSKIVQNTRLDAFYLKNSYYSKVDAMNELSEFAVASHRIDEIIYYIKDHDVMYGSKNIYSTIPNKIGNVFDEFGIRQDQLFNQLKLKNVSVISYDERIFYFVPNSNALGNQRIAIFVMNKEDFFSWFGIETNISDEYSYLTMIYDENEVLSNIPKSNIISSDEYVITKLKSKLLPVQFEKYTSKEIVLEDVLLLRKRFVYISLGGFIVILLFMFAFSKLSFKPIYTIRKISKQPLNRFNDIGEVVGKLKEANDDLEKKVLKFSDEFRSDFTKKLLYTGFDNKESYEKLLPFLNIKNLEIYSRIRIGIINDIEEFDFISSLKTCFEDKAVSVLEIVDDNSNNRVLIFHYDDNEPIFKILSDQIEKYSDIKILLSREINTFEVIPFHYIKMLSYKNFDSTKNQIILLETSEYLSVIEEWNENKFDIRLEKAFAEKDKDKILNIINQALEKMTNDSFKQYFEYLGFNLFNIIIKVCSQCGIDTKKLDIDYPTFSLWMKRGMYDQYNNEIKRIIDNILIMQYFDKYHFDEMINNTISYIRENYMDSSLTVGKVSDDLHYSYKYLSRKFKNETGQNISDYLYRIRISEFKKYFEENYDKTNIDYSMFGFSDEQVFLRRFKQLEGISFTQYRRLNKGKSDR